MAREDATYTLLGDQPNVDAHDSLGFDRIAEDLARLIVSSAGSTPLTLGIEAGWGQGKSSLMGRLECKLGELSPDGLRVSTARFNAWTAGEGDVLEGLVKSVLDQLDENVLRRLAKKRQLISWLRAGGVFVAHLLRLGSVVDRLWTELNVDPKARNEMRDLMTDAMAKWRDQDAKLGRDRLLVVFIDDLDRCSPENVFQVFEAMKLYLEAPGLLFVVGFDAGIISDAVLHEKHFSKELTGDRYLEKVIQVRYRIPSTGDEHARALIEGYLRDSGTEALFDRAAQTLVVDRNTRNPRRIKRFINSCILEYRVDDEWEELGAETLIRVLILDFYFPDFAKLLYGRAEREPIGEFLDYVALRNYMRRPPSTESVQTHTAIRARIDAAFKSYGLSPPDDKDTAQESLERLESELPEPMLELAGDSDFRNLVGGFGGLEERKRLRAKLERRSVAPVASDEDVSETPSKLDVAGMHILWIDDENPADSTEAERLTERLDRMIIHWAPDYESARPLIVARWPDAIISDVSRGGDATAGFSDLQKLRDDDGYDGPAIFYTGRVTAARRAAADALDAPITNKLRDVVRFLAEVKGDRLPTYAEAAER